MKIKKDAMEGTFGSIMTPKIFNKLMQLFPQPEIGMCHRYMKRLKNMPYGYDYYNRKTLFPGKRS
jgi:hypothetical protein